METILVGCTCNDPHGIQNGSPDAGPYNCNSEVFYRCSSGYSIVGSDRLRCESNGQWSGNPPSCQAEQCQPGDEFNAVTKISNAIHICFLCWVPV